MFCHPIAVGIILHIIIFIIYDPTPVCLDKLVKTDKTPMVFVNDTRKLQHIHMYLNVKLLEI